MRLWPKIFAHSIYHLLFKKNINYSSDSLDENWGEVVAFSVKPQKKKKKERKKLLDNKCWLFFLLDKDWKSQQNLWCVPVTRIFFYPITFPSLKFRGALSANVKSIIRLLFAFAKGTRMEREYGTRNVNVSTGFQAPNVHFVVLLFAASMYVYLKFV